MSQDGDSALVLRLSAPAIPRCRLIRTCTLNRDDETGWAPDGISTSVRLLLQCNQATRRQRSDDLDGTIASRVLENVVIRSGDRIPDTT